MNLPSVNINQIVEQKELLPPCQAACPAGVRTRDYIALIAQGYYLDALALIRKDLPLPSVCGRVCYHPCEESCHRGQIDEPLAIMDLKRFATEQVELHKLDIPKVTKNGKKVAVVGSGPAGLACANDLALLGYEVTVFEALPEPGGMLRVGIPEYRLPREVLHKDVRYIENLGVEIKTNIKIGEEITLEDLRQSYQAIFIATGAHESLKLGISGEDFPKVIPGVEFLHSVNMGQKVEIGRHVAIIGGGNVAIDAARVARRLGASSVTIFYRRSRQEMPANPAEVDAAEAEGIEIMFLTAPVRIIAEDGKVSKLECIKMKLSEELDASGRRLPLPIAGTEFIVPIDTVLPALGQAPNLEFLKGLGIKVSPQGTIIIDEATLATNIEGIFAGGDVVTGSKTVIDAIAMGKKAAYSIDKYLKGEHLISEKDRKVPERLSDKEIAEIKKQFPSEKRKKMEELAPEERIKTFQEVNLGYTEETALKEACRCLGCGAVEIIKDKCPACLTCLRLCPYRAPKLVTESLVEIQSNLCRSCGLCVNECPANAIAFTMPGLTDINWRIEKALSLIPTTKSRVLSFYCSYRLSSTTTYTNFLKTKPDNVGIVLVPCVSKISVINFLKAFELGADIVLVNACLESDCPYQHSMFWLQYRMETTRNILKQLGLGNKQLLMYNLAGTEMVEFSRIKELAD